MRRLVLCLLCCCLPASLRAGFETGGSWLFWFPQGHLERFSGGYTGIGASGRVGWRLPDRSDRNTTILFSEASFLDYGTRRQGIALDHGEFDWGGVILALEALRIHNDYSMLMLSPAGVNLERGGEYVKYYAEAFAGYSRSSSSSAFELWRLGEDYHYTNRIIRRLHYATHTWHLGWMLGMKAILWQRQLSTGFQGLREVVGDFRAGYVHGGRTRCLDTRSLREEDGELVYDTYRPSTSHAQFRFGLGLLF